MAESLYGASGSGDSVKQALALYGPALERAKTYDPQAHGARCDICPLAGNTVVPPAPVKKPRLVIVGEGPGRVEERWRNPFIGESGIILNNLIRDCQDPETVNPIRRSDAFVTNSALCRGDTDWEKDVAAACCAPRLLTELREIDSTIPIFSLGKPATRAILGVKSIMMARGFVWHTKAIAPGALRAAEREAMKNKVGTDRSLDIPRKDVLALRAAILRGRAGIANRVVLPMLHPAFIARLMTWQPLLEIDMRRGLAIARGEEVRLWDRGQYRVVSKPQSVHRELALLGGSVSCDIETDDIDPMTTKILCVGVSDGVRTVVVHPGGGRKRGLRWRKDYSPALQQFFENCREVVFHNGYNFDQIVMRQHGISFDKVKLEDTLLAQHAFASHLPKRLDQVVSQYVTSAPWKVKHGRRGGDEKGLAPHKMAPEEVCLYNAGDCRLTAKAWEAIQADVEPERKTYEHDKELSVICQRMTMEGIFMDPARRKEVRAAMIDRSRALKSEMRRLLKRPSFDPSKTSDVRWALFEKLKSPILAVTMTGLAATSAATLETLKTSDTRAGRLAGLVLDWRVVDKIRGTYVDAIDIHPTTGRVHYTWRPYGTVSGRWACRFQSLPRGGKNPEDRVGECYAAESGSDYIYFDLAQSEARAAAYCSGDDNFIATCESGDVHAGNASILFPREAELGWLRGGPKCPICAEEEKAIQRGEKIKGHGVDACSCPKGNINLGKPMRDIAKNAGFGILYSAEIDTIFEFLRGKGFDVERGEVVAMFDEIHRRYSTYYQFCENNLLDCQANGFMRTQLLQRIRWIGWYPKPGDVYNFPIQSLIADLMNLRIIELRRRLPKRVKIVAQIHDALVLEARRGKDSRLTGELVKELWAEPIELPNGRRFVMPIDLKQGERLSQFR